MQLPVSERLPTGPFWVTIDFFFDGPQSYAQFHDSEVLEVTKNTIPPHP